MGMVCVIRVHCKCFVVCAQCVVYVGLRGACVVRVECGCASACVYPEIK